VPLTFDEIAALESGARFVRADLHIHSIASKEDVKPDAGMTPEAIIDAAVAAGLEIISITDHNTIDALPAALAYAERYGDRFLFVPGIEVTAVEGHLLVYFDSAGYAKLEQFFHSLDIVRDDQGSRVKSSMLELVRRAAGLGGICVAAHIDTDIGFEVRNPGFPAWKKDLLIEPGLRGLEFRDPKNYLWYSLEDPSISAEGVERRKYAKARATKLGGRGALARLHNSDAHEMDKLIPPVGVTRIKVTNLNFDGFRAAFADAEARIRIEELVPASIPLILGVGIDGGFLDGTAIKFSSNLNVLFGGRGTGKSTVIRAIAFALGRESFAPQDSPFQSVSLFCEDASGVEYRFDRTAGGDVRGRIRRGGDVVQVSPDAFPIEFYGQGELGEVAKRSLTDPSALQDFLDRHIAFDGLLENEADVSAEVREAALQLAPLVDFQRTRKPLDDQLQDLEKRLKASEDSKIKQVAEFQNRLTAEKTLRDSLRELAAQYHRGVSLRSLMRNPAELRALSSLKDYSRNTKEAFEAIERVVDTNNTFISEETSRINALLEKSATEIDYLITLIDKEHVVGADQVQKYVDELREKGLAGSIAELNELSRRKTALVAQLARIDGQRPIFEEYQSRFGELLNKLGSIRKAIDEKRKDQRAELNAGFMRDNSGAFEVLLITDDKISAPEYEQFLATHLEGSYYQAGSIAALASEVSPGALADMLGTQDLAKLAAVKAIGAKWASTLLERLGKALPSLQLQALSRIKAPRFKVIDRGTKAERQFAHLSDGQKHTIMLTIALLGGALYPLVIDQPEDDLDNKFVAERVVRTLRDIKETRQVILVTHNANIAVLGDSEQLLAMAHNDEGGGKVKSRGSIDDAPTRREVQDCLEGGADALRRRWEVYGL
jgi:AAA domain